MCVCVSVFSCIFYLSFVSDATDAAEIVSIRSIAAKEHSEHIVQFMVSKMRALSARNLQKQQQPK